MASRINFGYDCRSRCQFSGRLWLMVNGNQDSHAEQAIGRPSGRSEKSREKFTREDLNARMFIAPDPNMKTKLPERINYENDVSVIVTKKYRNNIIDIQRVSSFFIDDSQDFNEEVKDMLSNY
ncbi:unnamed protein product [Rhizophagus irregularis]|nr:unnamed protein product [Rhizophagus irregularis]CAB5309054.1 unnamed protein product [Rhizophagus irregularis]